MKIYERFTAELDGAGEKNTESLSEVDLSNPEDVRATVEGQGTTVLVHFGEDQFLERFRKVKELLPRWHAQYPNLASADMRYEHEVPLAMAAPKGSVAAKPPVKPVVTPVPAHSSAGQGAPQVRAAVMHPAVASTKPVVLKSPSAVHPAARGLVPAPAVQPWQATPKAPEVPAKTGAGVAPSPVPIGLAGTNSVSASARAGYGAKPSPASAKAPASPAKPTIAASVKPPTSASVKAAVKAPSNGVAKQQIPYGNDKQGGVKQAGGVPSAVHTANSHGKPSAGKPLVTPDPNPTPQAAQR